MAPKRHRSSDNQDRYLTGFVLLLVGGGLLLNKLDLGVPDWLFTWPMILIIVGLSIGFRHSFRNPAWIILVGLGTFFISDRIMDDVNLKPYFLPIIIIGVGLIFLLRPKRKWHFDSSETDLGTERRETVNFHTNPNTGETKAQPGPGDSIDSVSIFSGVKKVVTSKNFKGGDIVCFMGGAEVDLTQADIQGPVVVELVQIFGGAKLVVPPHWEIRTSEAVAIFAGIEDKRPPQPGNFDPSKILIIKGVTIFGGIEIKSY
jgi:predicted membrane protein